MKTALTSTVGVCALAAAFASPAGQRPSTVDPTYVGSAACEHCHERIASRYAPTPMANVLRDPRVRPDAIIGDFSEPSAVRTFTRDDVAFVYGGKYKQRYFTRRGGNLFPLPATWDVTNREWVPYGVTGDTGPLCAGCHSVNYDIRTKQVTEWNVGCERCHI